MTLVELLVVISILALLIGILLPSLKKARQAAQRTACGTHLQQLGVAHFTYAGDNFDRFVPPGFSPTGGAPLWYWGESDGGRFAKYWAGHESQGEQLLICPSDVGPYPIEKSGSSLDEVHGGQTSYGLNGWMKRRFPGSPDYDPWGPAGNQISRIKGPARTMLMAEIWRWPAITDRNALGTGTWDAHYDPHPTIEMFKGNLEWDDEERHQGILNFLFTDGHVEQRTKNEGIPNTQKDRLFWGPNYDATTSSK